MSLSCSMCGLVPQPGIEPRPATLSVQSLCHWTTRKVPFSSFKNIFLIPVKCELLCFRPLSPNMSNIQVFAFSFLIL